METNIFKIKFVVDKVDVDNESFSSNRDSYSLFILFSFLSVGSEQTKQHYVGASLNAD